MPVETKGEVGSVDAIKEVIDSEDAQAHPASDERLELARALLDSIDTATGSIEAATGNFGSGYDNTVSPGDTNVTALSAGSVPDGVAVVVQADPDNAAPVKVGLTDSPAVRVAAGASLTAQVADRSQIRVQMEDSTDTVHVTHEVSA